MKNIAEMEAGLMKKLLKWKQDWWKEYCWVEAGFSIKFIIYTLLRIVRDELSAPNCPAPKCLGTMMLLVLY